MAKPTVEERIKKLRDEFEYSSDRLIANSSEYGGTERAARAKKNMSAKRKREREDEMRAKMKRQKAGGKIGKARKEWMTGEGKKERDRARHMELVLGPDWKKQTEDGRAISAELKKGDAKRRALDPENDPEMFSTLRNKLNINPTNAEVERRLMARGNARREQEKLSEGEAGGAVAGSAAERIRGIRMAREAAEKDRDHRVKRAEEYKGFTDEAALLGQERARRGERPISEPTDESREELLTGAFEENRRKKEYKGFTDEAALLGRERAMRGESPITDSTSGSLDDVGGEALAHLKDKERVIDAEMRKQNFMTEAERKEYGASPLEEGKLATGGLGELPPSVRARLRDPERGGTSIPDQYRPDIIRDGKMGWRGKTAELEGHKEGAVPGLKEWGISVNQESIEGDIEKGMAQDEEERAVNEEFTGMKQEEAQQAIRDADPEEQKQISKTVSDLKGHGPEWVETKEATGNYVSYEGSGLVINMASLQKDINRNRNMEMLKHIPAANRPAMLVEWGYIDPGDLSIAQKQSAKELKELSLLDLKIAKTNAEIEKNKAKLSPQDETAYKAAHKGMLDAAGKGNYELAETYRDQIHKLHPLSDTSSYGTMFEKMMEKNKRVTPAKIFKAAGLKSGEPYYASKGAITKLVDGLKTSKDTSAGMAAFLGQQVTEGENKGTTYGQLLKNHGIYSWEDISAGKKAGNPPPGIPEEFLVSEEAYMNWALPNIKNNLLTQIWGKIHTDVSQLNAVEFKKQRDELAQKVTTYDDDEMPEELKQKRAEKQRKFDEAREKKKAEKAQAQKEAEKPKTKSQHNKQVEMFTKRAEKSRERLADLRDSLSDEEIKQMETEIENYEKRASQFKKSGEEQQEKVDQKAADKKLHKELRAYNDKRKAAGLPWIRIEAYLKLKKEGKIK